MEIAVIGGSIAGCAFASALEGTFNVTVFERSQNLQSRGAGITMPQALIQHLMNKNLLDKDIQTFSAPKRSFYCQHPNKPIYGHCFWQQELALTSLHWETLFTNLRKRVPNSIYKEKSKVEKVTLSEKGPGQITLDTGETPQTFVFICSISPNGKRPCIKTCFMAKHEFIQYANLVGAGFRR